MDAQTQEPRGFGFVVGLLAGTFVGAGLAMWLVPRSASELRQRMSHGVKSLGTLASEEYQQASVRVGEAADQLVRKGDKVRDDVASLVARGAHEVERYAIAARGGRAPEATTHSPADGSAAMPHSL